MPPKQSKTVKTKSFAQSQTSSTQSIIEGDFNNGNTEESDVFHFRDKHNNTIIVASSNAGLYSENDAYVPRCDYCRLLFDKKDVVGIPLSLTRLSGKYICVMDRPTCSFDCSISAIKHLTGNSMSMNDSKYNNSLSDLLTLFKIIYPEKPKPTMAMDYTLLIANGGSLTEAKWKSKHTFFKRTINVQIKHSRTLFFG